MAVGIPYVEVLLAFAAILLAILYFRNKKDPRYPPGPVSLPIIGNLLQLGTKPQIVFGRWAEENGPIYSIKMGSMDVIVLNDHKIIKEVFHEASASGRCQNPVMTALAKGNHGIIMSEGPQWEQQRRFTIRKLRDQGFSKRAMEDLIMEEVNSMLLWLGKRLDKPISGNRIFNGAVVNSLWSIISGERNDWDGPKPPEILKNAEGMINALNRMNYNGLVFAPFLRFIAPDALGWTDYLGHIDSLWNKTDKTVQEHLKKLDPDNPHDLIDHYLIEKQNEQDPTSSFYKEKGDMNLRAVIPDLFLAGSETTSHTLSWAMLFLAHNPEVQKKVQLELDRVVDKGRHVGLGDRQNLPYMEAVVMELLRRTSLVINGAPHRMLEDAEFGGFLFPKNTTVMSNLFLVNNDPEVWGDPENFRPERFLSEDGSKVVRHEAYVPFSVGKRQCLGMTLANDSLFLFLANIFHKYKVKEDPSDNGNAIHKVQPAFKLLNEPDPFRIIVSLR